VDPSDVAGARGCFQVSAERKAHAAQLPPALEGKRRRAVAARCVQTAGSVRWEMTDGGARRTPICLGVGGIGAPVGYWPICLLTPFSC
jgi:hypothetical protein